jgi:MFS family permease
VLRFSNADVGLVSSGYLAGAVMGALFFGWLTDRLGRKRLFFITLVVYLLATAATALSWNIWSFALFSVPDRRGHWRRIHRHQFSDSGAGTRTISRLDRSGY